MNILDCLFPQLMEGEFIERYFPSHFCLGEGRVSRIEKLLQHSFDIAQQLGKPDRSLVTNVYNSPVKAGVDVVFALRKELDLRNDLVTGVIFDTPENKGVGRHYDGNEVLTVQLVGVKEWTIEPPTEPIFPDACKASPERLEITPTGRPVVLEPGGVMFLPRGWWHATRCITRSVSLNLEIRTEVWSSLLARALTKQLSRHLEWRTPIALATSAQKEAARQQVGVLQESLRQELLLFDTSSMLLPENR